MNHAALSSSRQRLVRLMQSINFGRVEGLVVRAGEPVFAPAPRVIKTVKLAGTNGPRPESAATDFAVKRELVEFLEHLDRLRDGIIPFIDVRHGLPLVMEIEGLIVE